MNARSARKYAPIRKPNSGDRIPMLVSRILKVIVGKNSVKRFNITTPTGIANMNDKKVSCPGLHCRIIGTTNNRIPIVINELTITLSNSPRTLVSNDKIIAATTTLKISLNANFPKFFFLAILTKPPFNCDYFVFHFKNSLPSQTSFLQELYGFFLDDSYKTLSATLFLLYILLFLPLFLASP